MHLVDTTLGIVRGAELSGAVVDREPAECVADR
jgi:hypothetical protein